MAVICPTITADNERQYREEIERVAHFAHRIHIDLSDGEFAPHRLIEPQAVWWPVGFKADFHLMYKNPLPPVNALLKHRPNLIIVHAEAQGSFQQIARLCHSHGIKIGVALLPKTSPRVIMPALKHIHHVLIFSGNLGYQGGSQADLHLLKKIKVLRELKPELEIGWDGGVNDQNIAELIAGGTDVVNVGGFIHSADDPARAFHILQRIADETGTT